MFGSDKTVEIVPAQCLALINNEIMSGLTLKAQDCTKCLAAIRRLGPVGAADE